ncbi:MAG: baseplate J/gp47 family protein [Patescibacteria group bacterium]
MNLRDFLASGGTRNGEFYWALVIEPGWIQAGVWQIRGEAAEVVAISPPTAWETEEELIGAADAALSAAVQTLPEDVNEPSKTVFGVPPFWVAEGQIKKEYLDAIRKLCADLSLEPAGFVVLPEAIAHYFKSQEGSPLNAIVLGIERENLEVAVFKLGNLVGTSTIARSVSISDDALEGLARFATEEALPSRILIYDGKEGELEDVRQSLLDTSWEEQEKIKFLHTPKVELIDPQKKVLATALAGASEIAQVSSISAKKPEFPEEEKPEEIGNLAQPEEVTASELGFVVGQDVGAKKEEPAPPEVAPQAPPVTPSPTLTRPFFRKFISPGFFDQLRLTLVSLFSRSRIGKGDLLGGKVFGIGVIALAAFLVVGFVWWWFFPKARVTIFVSPRRLEEKIDLTLDTNSQTSDVAKRVLGAKIIETDASGDKTKSTTGTKRVGEKARGSVKIQNGLASSITLTVGTVLVSSNDLRFTIDKTASVSGALSPLNPGTATFEVTASDIGAEYNIAKDDSFKVGNYPKAEVDALALANFSGGSSREIAAVSAADQEELAGELLEELAERAKSELAQEAKEDDFFLEDVILTEVTSRAFSNKVGDEAANLKLSLGVSAQGLVVRRQEFYELAREVLGEKVSSGFALRDEQISADFELTDESGGVYELAGFFTVNLLPEVNVDEITQNIRGRYPRLAENYLTAIAGFSRAEIKLSPNLPGRLGTLPRVSKNITIEVEAER